MDMYQDLDLLQIKEEYILNHILEFAKMIVITNLYMNIYLIIILIKI